MASMNNPINEITVKLDENKIMDDITIVNQLNDSDNKDNKVEESMPVKIIELKKENEYRFETEETELFYIRLRSGSAELFGVELALDREYIFNNNVKLAIFTWFGCTLEIKGKCRVAYVSEETPMILYINIHVQLEKLREKTAIIADPTTHTGPKLLIAGPVDAGKSTLCKILLNYAMRLGRKPIYVDLDVGQGSLVIPGSIAATPLDINSLSVEEGFIQSTPLPFFYGSDNFSENPILYKRLVKNLGEHIEKRMKNEPTVNASGMIVNTCGWIEGLGYEMLLYTISTLKIDIILVIGQDRLYSELNNDLNKSENKEQVDIVKVPRSGGVVPLTAKKRKENRFVNIKNYFHGYNTNIYQNRTMLQPSALTLPFDDVHICRVTDIRKSNMMLPVGESDKTERLKVIKIEITKDLIHAILGVWSIRNNEITGEDDYQKLLDCSVTGFVHVKEIDMKLKKITLIVPCPGPLPSPYLMCGSLKWFE